MNQNPDDLRTAGLHRGPNHIDYRETPDLTNVHSAVQREHSVGTPGTVPLPLWLMALCGVAVFWAGTSFSGGFGASYFDASNYSVHPGQEVSLRGVGNNITPQTQASPIELGQTWFNQNCATCHQPNGVGVPGSIPPLAGSEYVNGGTQRLGMILLKGLQGPVTVEGKPYGSAAMPSWGTQLNSKKIAYILTYVRQAFGNHGGAVNEAQIDDARKEYASQADAWHAADILAVPVNKELPGGEAPAPAGAPAPAAGGAAPAAK